VRAPARSIRSPCTMRCHIVTIAQRYARCGWARPAHRWQTPKGHRDVHHPGSGRPVVNAPNLPLSVEVQRLDPNTVVVRVTGELDTLTAPAVEAQLTTLQADLVTPAALIVDLSDVSFMSSAGLALLVAHHERCVDQGSRLYVVTGNNRSVLRPVRVTGLDTVLNLVDTAAQVTGEGG